MPESHNVYTGKFGIDIRPTTPETASNMCSLSCIYLIQVKTNWDLTTEHLTYLQHLIEFKVPFYVKKELHVWRNHVKVPYILNLNERLPDAV